ncbi:MAG TPA: ERF family protein [Roseateles sp.]
MKVYQAIKAVSAAMSQAGISKGRKNSQQGYNFRGIDDVLNSLSSALVEAGLVILPRVISRDVVERQTAKGGALFYVTVEVEFDLVATEDGTKHTVKTFGEAMDSADKATNKAMSAAYKYLALLTFCIPTEASPETDADFTTHDVASQKAQQRAAWLEEQAMKLESCESISELGEVWKAAFKTMKAERDEEAIATLQPIKDRMKATIEEALA